MNHRTTLPFFSAAAPFLSAAVFVGVFATSNAAWGQTATPPAGPPEAGQPPSGAPPRESEAQGVSEETDAKIHLSAVPPAPPLQRNAYVHEGFYLRVDVGPGWMWSGINDKDAGAGNTSGNGFALGADLLVGGSPSPGMAVGVGALTNTGFGIDMNDSTGTTRSQSTQFHFLVGPFFDAFPNDKRGFHLGAELGFAGAALNAPLASNAFGGGAAGWIGYDMWVAPEWSAGFLLRGNGAYLVGSEADAATFGLNLMITVLNH